MAAEALVRRTDTVKDLMSKPWVVDKLRQLVPKHLSPEKMARVMLLTISRDAKLQLCTPQSLLRALMRCAQIGLEPDGVLVHLIPFKRDVQIIIDWKGLVEIARRNGVVAKPILVRENDEFEYCEDDGTGRTAVKHKLPRGDRGSIIGAYSRTRTVETGEVDYEWMSIDEIEAIKQRSESGREGKGPWVTDYGEMCKKTPLRRHSKRWPLKLEDRKAVDADDDKPANLKEREHQEPEITIDPAPVPTQEEVSQVSQPPSEPSDEGEFVDDQPPPEAAPEPAKPAEPEAQTGGIKLTKLQMDVWNFLQTNKGTYDILQEILIDLKVPDADKWAAIYEVPDAVCKTILGSKRTVAVRMRHLASTTEGSATTASADPGTGLSSEPPSQ